ncbi:auxin efflux carrier [Auriculariales sp. MPI-PUGE-AT-0066]|nr:auxin efflux carrier [Auriculariales sp. MPI-PUGE-AT-0066]
MTASGIAGAIVGAIKGTVSVLMTMLAGYVVAQCGLLDTASTRRLSKLCSFVFLPLLLVSQIGEHLHPNELRTAWIVPFWGALSTAIAYAIGWLGKKAFKLPAWAILAAGRPNATALPLMLLEGLSKDGVLDALQRPGELPSDTLARARSLILLNVVVQQCITFLAGPNILAQDKKQDNSVSSRRRRSGRPVIQDVEHVGLLQDESDSDDSGDRDDHATNEDARHALDRLQDIPKIPKWKIPRILSRVGKVFNPPLIGACVAALLWVIPGAHHILFSPDGALHVPVATPIDNLGALYVSLQVFVVGAELAVLPWSEARPGARTTTFALLMRFAVMPALTLLFVWLAVKHGLVGYEPLIWFLLVLIPSGPSAMSLAALAETVGVSQAPIAGYLLVANLCSPLISITCAAGLALVKHLER